MSQLQHNPDFARQVAERTHVRMEQLVKRRRPRPWHTAPPDVQQALTSFADGAIAGISKFLIEHSKDTVCNCAICKAASRAPGAILSREAKTAIAVALLSLTQNHEPSTIAVFSAACVEALILWPTRNAAHQEVTRWAM